MRKHTGNIGDQVGVGGDRPVCRKKRDIVFTRAMAWNQRDPPKASVQARNSPSRVISGSVIPN